MIVSLRFVIALIAALSFSACADEVETQADILERAELNTSQVGPVLESHPKNLVNYSWRILYSIDANGYPCTHENCLRAEDRLFVLHKQASSSVEDFILLIYDLSSGEIKPFLGIGGNLERDSDKNPKFVEFAFRDKLPNGDEECRVMRVTPILTKSRGHSERNCLDALMAASAISDEADLRKVFGNSCGVENAVHWKVWDDASACTGETQIVSFSPPEPGQGTASGID